MGDEETDIANNKAPDTEDEDENNEDEKSTPESADGEDDDFTVSNQDPNVARLRELNKNLITLEQIEAIVAAEEEEEEYATAERIRKEKEEAEKLERGAGDTETEKIKEEKAPAEVQFNEVAEVFDAAEVEVDAAEEVEEEEEDEDFAEDVYEEPKPAQEQAFMGFDDDEVDAGLQLELTTDVLAPTFDAMILVMEIFHMAVDRAQYKSLDTILRIKLDKNKLIQHLRGLWPLVATEQKKHTLLERKMVHFFRRKKMNRAFVEDNPNTVLDLMEKYHDNLMKLDDIKAKKKTIEEEAKIKILELAEEESEMDEITNNDAMQLEDIFRESAKHCFSEKTGTFLSSTMTENLITKITLLRNQVSELRLALIKSQHRMAFLNDKARKLEDLGDGLCQTEFEQLHAETQSLADKIEEKNNELSKLRIRYNTNTHMISSIREKLNMLGQTIVEQEKTLREQREEVLSIRNYLNKIKVDRDTLRRKLKKLSFECGLLDKPILLHDYDTTTSRVDELEASIKFLKDDMLKYKNMIEKIYNNTNEKNQ